MVLLFAFFLQVAVPREATTVAPPIKHLTDHLAEALLSARRAPTAGEVLDTELVKFRGRPQQYAFDRLGYPDHKMIIGGVMVYSWINNDTNIDGGALTCTVKVVVKSSKIIRTDFHGNNGACDTYARLLDPSFDGKY